MIYLKGDGCRRQLSSSGVLWEVRRAVCGVRGEAWRAGTEVREAATGRGRALAEEQRRPAQRRAGEGARAAGKDHRLAWGQ